MKKLIWTLETTFIYFALYFILTLIEETLDVILIHPFRKLGRRTRNG